MDHPPTLALLRAGQSRPWHAKLKCLQLLGVELCRAQLPWDVLALLAEVLPPGLLGCSPPAPARQDCQPRESLGQENAPSSGWPERTAPSSCPSRLATQAKPCSRSAPARPSGCCWWTGTVSVGLGLGLAPRCLVHTDLQVAVMMLLQRDISPGWYGSMD